MKRVFHHPPEPSNGTKYWRSIGELNDTPEFRQWLEREFPAGAAELNGDEWSRRDFVKLMGASMALAGVGLTSCRRPELHLVPFTKNVEWTIPGKFLYYATAMPRRNGGIPLIATTVDGRPIKLEGNPLHPASGGTTDTFVQASILDLYDPTRSKRFVQKGKPSSREEFEKFLGEFGKTILNDQGRVLRFWSRRRIRRRESVFAQNWRKNFRECGGAFTSRGWVRTQMLRRKQLSAPTHGYCRNWIAPT